MSTPLIAILRNAPAEGNDFVKEIQEYLAENKIEEKAGRSVQLIFDELFTHMVKHGFPNGASGQIQAHLFLETEKLKIWIRDNGADFDPNQFKGPGGLQHVHALSEEVTYERLNGWNEIRVTVPRT